MTLNEFISFLGANNGDGGKIRFPQAVYPKEIESNYIAFKIGTPSLLDLVSEKAPEDAGRSLASIYSEIRETCFSGCRFLLPDLNEAGESTMQHIGGKKGISGFAALNKKQRDDLLGRIFFLTLNYAFDAWYGYFISRTGKPVQIITIADASYEICSGTEKPTDRYELFITKDTSLYARLSREFSVKTKDLYLMNLCYLVSAATLRLWFDECRKFDKEGIPSREDNEDIAWAISQLHPVIPAEPIREKIAGSTWEKAFKNRFNPHTQFTDLGDDVGLFDYYVCPDLKRTKGDAKGLLNSMGGSIRTVLQAVSGYGKSTAVSCISAGLAVEQAFLCGLISEENYDIITNTARKLFGIKGYENLPDYTPITITGKEFNEYAERIKAPASLIDVFANISCPLSEGEKKALIDDIEDDPKSYLFIIDAIDEIDIGKLPLMKELIKKAAEDPDTNILITHRLTQRSEDINSLLGSERSEWTILPLNEWGCEDGIPKAELLFRGYVRCLLGSSDEKRKSLAEEYGCSGSSVEKIAASLYGYINDSKSLCPFLSSPFTSAALVRRICLSCEKRISEYKLIYGSINAIIDRFNLAREFDIRIEDYKKLICRLAHSMYQRSMVSLATDKLKENFVSAASDTGIDFRVMMDEVLLEKLNEQTGLLYFSPDAGSCYVFQADPISQDFLAGQDLHRIFARYKDDLKEYVVSIKEDKTKLESAVMDISRRLDKEMDGIYTPERCLGILRCFIPALYDNDLFADTNRVGGPNEKALICLAVADWLGNNDDISNEERVRFLDDLRAGVFDSDNVFAGIDPFSSPRNPAIRNALDKVLS